MREASMLNVRSCNSCCYEPARSTPHNKVVFPTASKRRATRFKKMPINQWFDNYSHKDPGDRTDLQVEGFCESAEFIRDLKRRGSYLRHGQLSKGHPIWGCATGFFTLLGDWPDASEISMIGAFLDEWMAAL
ncbi:Phospholipase/carboxylesterase/thioesterase [Penicillium chrysogenum]|uniref:Phospholipase/carboxylesterase/thioesterase n=1 Tax=Penicillium chrysogenum TaxID=5076 RepID=A0ABQ8W1I6_PENCH|nr:Phospholipase/carboxylesterase/thioesterase [Penicillium chrysogenum]KAJ5230711.1 Phospholipase/carboxylesterase/thioesterase [Penicillium chrysogenum]KAJ5254586.1 Phospholipase/carboxylesterase/thioesterase [Penicillium chrysogenum]KAJ5268186.1 Phospholipase/carboxylesterase/thioesterase [Penicillium chrysogenum]KAJ6163055.1 Phospholipase/carboxylesterase/thioesterase [Penicillium chrysogenum]